MTVFEGAQCVAHITNVSIGGEDNVSELLFYCDPTFGDVLLLVCFIRMIICSVHHNYYFSN